MMDIEEEPFETLDIVEVFMNNESNEFRKIVRNLETNGIMIYHVIKLTCKC